MTAPGPAVREAARATIRPAARLPLLAGLLTLVVGAVGLGRPSYWGDEALTLSAVSRPFPELLDLLGTIDAVHGTYYVLLWVWTQLVGVTEVATRSLSLLGLATAATGLALLARRLAGPRVAALTSLVALLCPGLTWVAQEARPSALAVAACVWSVLALLRAFERPGPGRWVAWATVTFLAAMLQAFTLLMLPVTVVLWWLVVRPRDDALRVLRALALAWAAVVVAVLPLLTAMLAQRGQVAWIDVAPGDLPRSVRTQLFQGQVHDLGAAAQTALVVAPVVALVVVVLACVLRPTRAEATAMLGGASWFLLPTAALAATVVVPLGPQLYVERYLVFAVPGACLTLGAALAVVARRAPGPTGSVGTVAVVLVLASFSPLVVAQRSPTAHRHDLRAMAELARDADTVVFTDVANRMVAWAYPDVVGEALDLELASTAVELDGLFATNGPPEEAGTGAAGRTVLYWFTDADATREAVTATLVEQGCEITDETATDGRFAGQVVLCPSP